MTDITDLTDTELDDLLANRRPPEWRIVDNDGQTVGYVNAGDRVEALSRWATCQYGRKLTNAEIRETCRLYQAERDSFGYNR